MGNNYSDNNNSEINQLGGNKHLENDVNETELSESNFILQGGANEFLNTTELPNDIIRDINSYNVFNKLQYKQNYIINNLNDSSDYNNLTSLTNLTETINNRITGNNVNDYSETSDNNINEINNYNQLSDTSIESPFIKSENNQLNNLVGGNLNSDKFDADQFISYLMNNHDKIMNGGSDNRKNKKDSSSSHDGDDDEDDDEDLESLSDDEDDENDDDDDKLDNNMKRSKGKNLSESSSTIESSSDNLTSDSNKSSLSGGKSNTESTPYQLTSSINTSEINLVSFSNNGNKNISGTRQIAKSRY